MVLTLSEYCRSILLNGDLESKLRPPVDDAGDRLVFDAFDAQIIERPAREGALEMTDGNDKLPKRKALREKSARARCIERFAGHELQAVELFAWALLAFPDMPDALKRGLVQTLAEEQTHLKLYLDRLAAHGGALGDKPLSSYFWRTVPGCLTKERPLLAFLAGMGLTLEQANLDFTLFYRDAFADAGDEETAAVIQRVHDDEIRHVRLASVWMRRLAADLPASEWDDVDIAQYEAAVPFPLAANRAKGRRFDRTAREQAGLSAPFIDHIDAAQPHRVLPKHMATQADAIAEVNPPRVYK